MGEEINSQVIPCDSLWGSAPASEASSILWTTERDNELLWDVELLLDDGTRVPANRWALAQISGYFRSLFSSAFLERKQRTLPLKDLASAIVLSVMQSYFARTQLEVSTDSIADFMEVADRLQIEELKKQCELFISTCMMTSTYVCAAFQIASRHSSDSVKDHAVLCMELFFNEQVANHMALLDEPDIQFLLSHCNLYSKELKHLRGLYSKLKQRGVPVEFAELWQLLCLNLSQLNFFYEVNDVVGKTFLEFCFGEIQDLTDVKEEATSGRVFLTKDTVESYLMIARSLGAAEVSHACAQYIRNNMINFELVGSAWNVANKYCLEDVEQEAYQYLQAKFEPMMQQHMSSFTTLPKSLLLTLLEDSDLVVDSEISLLEWYRRMRSVVDRTASELTVLDIMDAVRLPTLSMNQLAIIGQYKIVQCNLKALQRVMDEIFRRTKRGDLAAQVFDRVWSGPVGYVPQWNRITSDRITSDTHFTWRIRKFWSEAAPQPNPRPIFEISSPSVTMPGWTTDAGPWRFFLSANSERERVAVGVSYGCANGIPLSKPRWFKVALMNQRDPLTGHVCCDVRVGLELDPPIGAGLRQLRQIRQGRQIPMTWGDMCTQFVTDDTLVVRVYVASCEIE